MNLVPGGSHCEAGAGSSPVESLRNEAFSEAKWLLNPAQNPLKHQSCWKLLLFCSGLSRWESGLRKANLRVSLDEPFQRWNVAGGEEKKFTEKFIEKIQVVCLCKISSFAHFRSKSKCQLLNRKKRWVRSSNPSMSPTAMRLKRWKPFDKSTKVYL